MEEEKYLSSSFTMDYERSEIVVTIYDKDSQSQTSFTEKDIKAMQNWFELEKNMRLSNE